MKNILSILVLMIASSIAGMAQWTQTSGPDGGRIRSIAVDGSTLLAGTWAGTIYRHDEGGWKKAADLKVNNLLAANGIFLASISNGSPSFHHHCSIV